MSAAQSNPAVTAPLVRLTRVYAGYSGRPALYSIDLTVSAGAFIGIVGPSGAGKTSLLRLLLGRIDPTAGTVDLARGALVGYVPQVETINWDFPITVAEFVLVARGQTRLWPGPTRAERKEVAAVLDSLGIADIADRKIRDLSGGQQQRMFLARALIRRPNVLLLDEPTSGLDLASRHNIMHLLSELADAGVAVVVTTHDLNGIANHVPQLVCLNKRIVAAGPPVAVLTPTVLERTFAARMDVLQHAGLLVVVDRVTTRAQTVP